MARPENQSNIYKKGRAKFWMLLIGVNEYADQHLEPLKCAENDCEKLAVSLDKVTSSFPQKRQFIYRGQDSSHERIRAGLEQIRTEAEEKDTVLVYFAGHGYTNKDKTYLCLAETVLDNLSDKNSISLSYLFKTLKDCSAKQQLVLIDACYSGDSRVFSSRGSHNSYALGQEVVIARSADSTRQGVAEGIIREVDQHSKNTTTPGLSFFALLSCDEHQKSYEYPILKHGIFTYFLIKGLEGDAAESNSGIIRPLKLFSYVVNETTKLADECGYKQTPRVITNGTEFEIGEFLDQAQNTPEKRAEEFTRIYREVRRQHSPTEEDRCRLEQEWKRLSIRDKVAEEVIDDWNHRFEQCENKIKEYIASRNLPVREEECDLALLNEIRQEKLLNEDIEPVWKRIVTSINEQFEAWKHQLLDFFQEYGSTYEFSLERLPNELTEINVRNTVQSLCADFAKREEAYRQGFADCIAKYGSEINANAYPETLEAERQKLLAANGLCDGKPYVTDLEQNAIATHQQTLARIKAEAKLIITRNSLPFDAITQRELQQLGESSQLPQDVFNQMVQQLSDSHGKNISDCKSAIHKVICNCYPDELTETHDRQIQELITQYLLTSLTSQLREQVLNSYAGKCSQYAERVSQDLHRYDEPRLEHESGWEALARRLQLSEHSISLIEEKCRQDYQAQKSTYQDHVQSIIRNNGSSIDVNSLFQEAKPYQDSLNLLDLVAHQICEQQLLGYDNLCQHYAQFYHDCAKDCYPPNHKTQDLRNQAMLGIHPDDIKRIEAEINQQQDDAYNQYCEQIPELVYRCYPIDETIKTSTLMPALRELQHQLSLGDQTVELINDEIIGNHERALTNYKQCIENLLITRRRSLQDPEVIKMLRDQRAVLEILNDMVVTQIHCEVEQDAEQRRARKQDARRKRLF